MSEKLTGATQICAGCGLAFHAMDTRVCSTGDTRMYHVGCNPKMLTRLKHELALIGLEYAAQGKEAQVKTINDTLEALAAQNQSGHSHE